MPSWFHNNVNNEIQHEGFSKLSFFPHPLFYQYVKVLIMVLMVMSRSIEHVLGNWHERVVRKFKSHEGRSRVRVGE